MVCVLTSEGIVSTKIVWNQLKVMREKSMLKYSRTDVMTSHTYHMSSHSLAAGQVLGEGWGSVLQYVLQDSLGREQHISHMTVT